MKLLAARNAFAVAAMGTATFAFAHSGATGVVKERMDGMKEISYAAKAIGAVRAGAIPFSLETLHAAAGEIVRHGAAARGLFPEGSDGGVSEAVPLIWEDRAGFDRLLDEMIAAAEALQREESESAALEVAAGIAETCKACHARYRKKK